MMPLELSIMLQEWRHNLERHSRSIIEESRGVIYDSNMLVGCRATQHYGIRHNDTQHNDTQHNNKKCDTQHNGTWPLLSVIMLNVANKLIRLAVIVLSVVMLNVIILSVVAPFIVQATDLLWGKAGKSYRRERLNTVDLLVPPSLDQFLF